MITWNGFNIKKLPELQFLYDFFKVEEEHDIDVTVIGEFDKDYRLVIRELYLDNNEMSTEYIEERICLETGIKPDLGFLVVTGSIN